MNHIASNKCTLPSDKGPCKASILRWYFNTQAGECQVFSYGGCRGNKNNFQSRKECEKGCDPDGLARGQERTILILIFTASLTAGAWNTRLLIWTNDVLFVRPFFDCSKIACTRRMLRHSFWRMSHSHTDVCSGAAPSHETCGGDQKLARWRFESESNRCLPFYTKGCDPSVRNSFVAEDHCLHTCPPKQGKRLTNDMKKLSHRWF